MNAPTTPSLAITWQQPTFLLPLFCLCPLLAASSSIALAIALSLLLCVATSSAVAITFMVRKRIPDYLHTFVWLILSSTIVTVLEMILHAWNYELFRALGLFLPLIVIACLLITRPEMQEQLQSPLDLFWRTLKMNIGFSFAAIVLGGAREIVGHGSLFHDGGAILGLSWQSLSITFFHSDMGFLLAVLAPGAFIGLGIGVALYNWAWIKLSHKNTDDHA